MRTLQRSKIASKTPSGIKCGTFTKGTRKQPKGETRPLCNALINAGRVYRKEDIQKLSSKGGAEAKGQSYSVWKYKGGANCYHRWERRVYRKKLNKLGSLGAVVH